MKRIKLSRKKLIVIALTLAIENWLSSSKREKGSLSELKPRNWGAGTEHLSEGVDKVIYCEAR